MTPLKHLLFSIVLCCGLCFHSYCRAQNHNETDSLLRVFKTTTQDTIRYKTSIALGNIFQKSNSDSAIHFHRQAYLLAEKLSDSLKIANALCLQGVDNCQQGSFDNAKKIFQHALSALEIINSPESEKLRIRLLNDMGLANMNQDNYQIALSYFLKTRDRSKQINDKKTELAALGDIGIIYKKQGMYSRAMKYYLEALEMAKKLGDRHYLINNLANIGNVYDDEGKYPQALEYFFKALKENQIQKNKRVEEIVTGNIGNVYLEEDNYAEALKYYFKALKVAQKFGDKNGKARYLENIGIVYTYQKNYPLSLQYCMKALALDKQLGYKLQEENTLGNIGVSYERAKHYKQALKYDSMAMNIAKELGDRNGIMRHCGNLASVYINTKKYSQAVHYLQVSLFLSDSLHALEATKENERNYSRLDSILAQKSKLKNNWRQAAAYLDSSLMHYKRYVTISDSINSRKNIKKQAQLEANYKYEKKEAATKAEQEKKDLLEQEARRRQNIWIFSIAVVLLLVVLFALFVVQRLRITRKQKRIIELQKQVVDEKNREIADSINYARRIQLAILPPREALITHLKNGFVLFKPKDVVSGDFYWLNKPVNDNGAVLFAVADCTGHGVPGAMVSVVCHNALNRSVREFGLTDPGRILDKTRELVIETFEQSEENVKDGMDISLCSLSGNDNLQWAGANNPLWIIRSAEVVQTNMDDHARGNIIYSEDQKYALIEIKADKQPIGNYELAKPFNCHNIKLYKNDSIYIFSDGYADQFGGPNGKKFKYKALKELLLSIQGKSMDEQKTVIEATFNKWKGGLEQIDDVCIIGMRI